MTRGMGPFSRRALLKWSSMAFGLGPVLQACAPAPPSAAPTPPAAAAATPQVITKEVVVTPTPKSTAKITGNLQVIQQRGFNPLQTTFIHNLLLKTAADKGWPLDKSYVEGFTAGTNIYEKLSAQVAAGDSPDLMIGNEDTFQFWNLKLVQPVDDIVEWAVKQYGAPSPIQKLANYIDGKWYAVPFWNATGGYWVRKSWFDETGFDTVKQHSLQEWLEAAVKVSNADKKRWGWGNTVNRSGDGNTNVRSVVYQAGGRVTTADNKVAFNSPETVEAYEWLKDVYTNPKWAAALPPGVNAWTDPSNNEAYLAGTIGFSSNGGTMVATAFSTKREIVDDTVLIPHPTGPAGKKEALVVSGPYNFHNHIFQGGKNPEAARELFQILMSKETLTSVWDNSPVLAMPAYKDFGWDLKTFQQVPNNIIGISRRLLWEDLPFQRFQPQNQPRLWINATDSENIETDVMAEVLKGTPTKEAVANGHARMEKILEKFEGK
jgi:multiple sugar transport system substrate-binding protein